MLMSFEVGKRPSNMLTGGSTEKTKTFLRQTSLLAKVLDVFTKARLLDFVREVVSPVLRRVVEVSKDVVLETDESRAPDGGLSHFTLALPLVVPQRKSWTMQGR
eukprot:Sspe_Gene.117987::Locus_110415_Transcript_2_3_Confidence_0.600_Length_312::g.117987::m.117987